MMVRCHWAVPKVTQYKTVGVACMLNDQISRCKTFALTIAWFRY